MGTTYTTRLQLAKPDENEYQVVGVINNNSDALDKLIGARMVAANVIPPANELYDGLVVNERDTGKSWVASSNGSGGYDRAWIRYPWYLYSVSGVVGSWGNGEARNLAQTWSNGVNSTPTDVPSGYIRVPIQGVYSFAIYSQWGTVQTLAGTINVTYQVGATTGSMVNSPFTAMHRPSTTLFNTVTVFPPMQYNAGTLIMPRLYQLTGDTCNNVWIHCVLQMMGPTGKNNA
jgi:hypothetical protein